MKKLFTTTILLFLQFMSFSQTPSDDVGKAANSTKSDQEKELLANFYQIALKNIFSKGPEISYTGTAFGLFDSLKTKVDSVYGKYKWARNLQYAISGKVDSNYRLTSYGVGITYAILNLRDVSDKKYKPLLPMTDNDATFNSIVVRAEKTLQATEANWDDKFTKITASIKKYNTSRDENDLDKDLVETLKNANAYDSFKYHFIAEDEFNDALRRVKQRPLLTVTGQYNRNITTTNMDTATLKLDFLCGFAKKKQILIKPWLLTADVFGKYYKSTPTAGGTNITSEEMYGELGIDKIMAVDKNGNSQVELKVFASYDKLFLDKNISTTMPGATDGVMANSTFRFNVYKNLWLPITIKYDPRTGNIFGFLNITADIDKVTTASTPKS